MNGIMFLFTKKKEVHTWLLVGSCSRNLWPVGLRSDSIPLHHNQGSLQNILCMQNVSQTTEPEAVSDKCLRAPVS